MATTKSYVSTSLTTGWSEDQWKSYDTQMGKWLNKNSTTKTLSEKEVQEAYSKAVTQANKIAKDINKKAKKKAATIAASTNTSTKTDANTLTYKKKTTSPQAKVSITTTSITIYKKVNGKPPSPLDKDKCHQIISTEIKAYDVPKKTYYLDSEGYWYIDCKDVFGSTTMSTTGYVWYTDKLGVTTFSAGGGKYKISTSEGWFVSTRSAGVVVGTTDKTTDQSSSSSSDSGNEEIEDNGRYAGIESGATTSLTTDSVIGSDMLSKSMNGIFGLPYQWMESCDNRLTDSDFGRMYAQKIASRMPLLFLTPGVPSYMPNADADTIENLKSTLVQNIVDGASVLEGAVEKLLGSAEEEGCNKYYSFDFAYDDYYEYVNPMCQITAKLLGFDSSHQVTINGSKRNLSSFSWDESLESSFSDYFSAVNAIPFYIDGATSVSESFSNDTTASSLASITKSVSSSAKELNFLMGTAGAISSDDSIIGDAKDKLNEYIGNLGDTNSTSIFLNNVLKGLSAIASGGSMLFPEIWDNSSFGRSYNVNIKLRSPDCDDLSIYLNVLVPLYHLIGMVAPHTIKNNYNTYSSPFLVRAYCKGMFNIDMGIITSMDVSKGKEGSWNANGLPTEMDISLTIKDLYELFSITGTTDSITGSPGAVVKNTAMMDYLCNTIGLNLNKSELQRMAQIYIGLTGSNIKNWPHKKWLQFQTSVDNTLHDIFSLRSS